MLADADLAAVADLMTAHRATLLLALMDGRARPASDLAQRAGISRSLASAHLAKLLDGGLVVVEPHGRQRHYRLAGPRVAEAIEAMVRIAPASLARGLGAASRGEAIRHARTCYDHLAGGLGVAVTDALERERMIESGDDAYAVPAGGAARLAELGIDVAALRRRRRSFARPCLDWTERRPHLAGALGAAVADRCFSAGWVQRLPGSRAVAVTPAGRRGLREALGVELAAT